MPSYFFIFIIYIDVFRQIGMGNNREIPQEIVWEIRLVSAVF